MRARLADVGVAGIAAAVPRHTDVLDPEVFRRFSAVTGIRRRRLCPPDLFFSDLASAAAERLLADLAWQKKEIGGLVVLTQSPDLAYPATACILQHRLGLPTSCAALDLTLGCSGCPYGLVVAGRMLGEEKESKALLLIGDAAGKPNPASPQPPLFGDAAAVVALERRSGAPEMMFSLHTDGSGWDAIMERRPKGKPGFEKSFFTSVTDDRGLVHLNTQQELKGEDVFNFSARVVPGEVREALAQRAWSADSVDAFVFHQASLLINENIRKSLGLDPGKTPSTLENYANTSSATIPLTMVDQLGSRLRKENLRLLLCGFGVGLSWGTLTCEIGPLTCPPLVEV